MVTASALCLPDSFTDATSLLDAEVLPPCIYSRPRARRPRPALPTRPHNWPIMQALEQSQPFVPAEGNRSPAYRLAKRAFDVAGALAILLVLAPLMLAIYLALLITTRANPLYCQRRVGYLGRMFTIMKFRTMRSDAEQLKHRVANEQGGPVFKNRRDPRVTRLGRLLRKTSLDETPQLLNVLLGHMSLVGPRPLVPGEVARFRAWHCRRLAVMPGLTCLWQVSGRSEIGFEDWVRMDLWYVRNQDFWTDCKLLLRTPMSVLSCRGAY